jgi:hypothetical protein
LREDVRPHVEQQRIIGLAGKPLLDRREGAIEIVGLDRGRVLGSCAERLGRVQLVGLLEVGFCLVVSASCT